MVWGPPPAQPTTSHALLSGQIALRSMLFPNWAMRWESRRHLYQGILFLAAALAWLLVATTVPGVPEGLRAWLAKGYPFLPLVMTVALVKAALR